MHHSTTSEVNQQSMYYLLISLYLALICIFIVFASVKHNAWKDKIITYLPEMLESIHQTFGNPTPERIIPTAGVHIVDLKIPEAKHGGFSKMETHVHRLFQLHAGSDVIFHQHHLSFSLPLEASMSENEANRFYQKFKVFLQHSFEFMHEHPNAHLEIILETNSMKASGPMRIRKALHALLAMQKSLEGRVHLATQNGPTSRLIVRLTQVS